jgi:hypothetical protein
MTDRPRSPDTGDDSGRVYDRESTTGIPRWVKVVGIIAVVVVLLVVVMLLVGGGDHGPRRHGSGGFGGQAPPSSVTAVHVPPLLAAKA